MADDMSTEAEETEKAADDTTDASWDEDVPHTSMPPGAAMSDDQISEDDVVTIWHAINELPAVTNEQHHLESLAATIAAGSGLKRCSIPSELAATALRIARKIVQLNREG